MRNGFRSTALLVLTVALMALTIVGPASAGTTQVSGLQRTATPIECAPADAPLLMTGDLQGCWYSTGHVQTASSSGVLVIRGSETFVGCTLGRCGTLTFSYVFNGKFTPTLQELMGRCEHKVVAGTADLAGTTGSLHFKDDVVTGNAPYTGHLKL